MTAAPPHRVARAVFTQRWSTLAYLHWPVEPSLVAPLLPRGTEPDVLDGVTWVGLVPFVMERVRILGTPPLPYLSRFAETNVRLYAHDGTRRGVVFRSLEAARLLPVLAAQVGYHLPYRWARMTAGVQGSRWTYASTRRPGGQRTRIALDVGERLEPGPLEHFLSARWGLFSTWYAGRTAWAPVEHPPWELRSARLIDLDDELVRAAGLEVSGDPHVMWSPGVEVRIGRPRLLPLT